MSSSPRLSSRYRSSERDYGTKDYGSKDYSTKDYSSKDYSTKDYSTKDYTSGSSSTSASGTRDYTSSRSSTRDYTSTRDYSSKDYSTKDYSSSVSTRDSDTRTSYRDRLADLDAKYNLTTSPTAKKGGEEDDFVGFATLPDQVHRKAVKRGFDFTLMVVGESGLGKSTLISSLFLSDLYKDKDTPTVEDKISSTVTMEKKYMEIEEKGVKLRLTIVDTPGYNDAVNCDECWKPIEDYIDSQFEQYLTDESGLNRKNIKDNRVHCCIYFISPYGRGLRQVDVEFMKHVHEKVNIVPVIAKSDTLTPIEVKKLKSKILEEIEKHGIKIYEFPDCDSDEDDEFKKQDLELKASIPFAVVGSNTVVEVNGKKVRGRLYPWGIVEVDNAAHCDFNKLRQMLISTHMQDLKDVTRDVHYENYRARHIAEQLSKQQLKERNKLKRDSSPNFDAVQDQDKLLQQKDDEIRRMTELLARMQSQLSDKKSDAQPNGHHNGLQKL